MASPTLLLWHAIALLRKRKKRETEGGGEGGREGGLISASFKSQKSHADSGMYLGKSRARATHRLLLLPSRGLQILTYIVVVCAHFMCYACMLWILEIDPRTNSRTFWRPSWNRWRCGLSSLAEKRDGRVTKVFIQDRNFSIREKIR